MATKKGRRATKENKAQGVAKKRQKPIHRASLAKKVATKKAMPKKAALGKAASKKATPKKATPKKAVLARAAEKQAMAKKAVAKPAPAKRPEKKAPALAKAAKQPIRRRDGSGHLDPKYAAKLRRLSGAPAPKEDNFVDGSRSKDDLAEILAEQFVERATTGEEEAEEMLDQEVPEERGGPFVPSTAGAEFAEGTDPSNPKGSKREPFPTT
jgi:hypothetical protein